MRHPICEVVAENPDNACMFQTEGGFIEFDGLWGASKYVGE